MPLLPLPPFAVFAANDFHIGGDIGAVTDTARKYHAFGEAALTAGARMAGLHDGGFEGSEGDQYRELLNNDFPRHLEITGTSHTGMGLAIDHYAAGLTTATTEMNTLRPVAASHHAAVQASVAEYNIAEVNAARAAATAAVARATAIATAGVPGLNATTAAAAAAAEAEAQAAELARQAAMAKYEAARAVWEADLTTASGIKDALRMVVRSAVGEVAALARATFDENPNWLEQVWDKIDKFFDENAEVLKFISDALQIVGTIMLFIPGLQVVGIALIATGVGLKGMLAATGNCSWGEFFFDLATCGAFGGMFKLAKLGKLGNMFQKGANATSKASTAMKNAMKPVLERGKKILAAGDPVDMATGSMVNFVTDVEIPGVLPLVVDRNTNSMWECGRALGPRWVSRMDTRLEICKEEVFFVSPDGAILTFPPAPLDGSEVQSSSSSWLLSFGDGAYYVRNIKEGLTYRFDIAGENSAVTGALADTSPAEGQNPAGSGVPAGSLAEAMDLGIEIGISSVTHHTGHHIDYHYDQATGHMTSMVRSDGTTLTITWDPYINRAASVWVSNPTTHPEDEPIRLISYEYDGYGQLIRVINSHAGVLRYGYDEAGRPNRWTDRNNVSYHYRYDEQGRVKAQVGTGGVFPNVMYWGPDTAADAPEGGRVCVLIETAGEFTGDPLEVGDEVIDTYLERLTTLPLYTALVEGGLEQAGLTGRGRTESREDAGFHQDWTVAPELLRDELLGDLRPSVYRSTKQGDVWRIVTPEGSATDTFFNDSHQPVREVTAAGAHTEYLYNESGLLVETHFPDGTSTIVQPGTWGQPVSVIDRDGLATEYSVDAFGMTTAVTDPTGATTAYEYELRTTGAVLQQVTTPTGVTMLVDCDDAGRDIAVTNPSGLRTSRTLDVRGLVVETMDEAGYVTTIDYTPEGWPTLITHPDGTTVTATYDGEGNRLSVTNENGATTTSTFTVFDKPLTSIDAEGAETRLVYNTQMEPVRVINADGNTWTFRHNLDGVVMEEVDYNGIVTSFRTSVDELTSVVTTPAGSTTTYSSVLGLIEKIEDASGTTTFDYDRVGRMVRAMNSSATVTFTRDEYGRPVSEMVELASGERTVHSLEFTPQGMITGQHLDLPIAGRFTAAFEADHHAVSRSTISRGDGSTIADIRFGTDERGHRTGLTVGAMHRTFTHDQLGRLTRDATVCLDSSAENGYRTLAERSYTWRADSVITAVTDHMRGHLTLDVDKVGRATSLTKNTSEKETYGYSPAGVLNAISTTGQADSKVDFAGTKPVRVGRTTYTYDKAGRVTTTSTKRVGKKPLVHHFYYATGTQPIGFSSSDHPEVGYRYVYDAFGRRVAKETIDTVSGEVTHRVVFTHIENDLAAQTVTKSPIPQELGTGYVWVTDPGTDRIVGHIHLRRADSTDSTVGSDKGVVAEFFATIADVTGSTHEIINPETGEVLGRGNQTLYGQRTWSGTQSTPLLFTGQYLDHESNWAYNRFRYYHPQAGVYNAQDPLGAFANIASAQAYVHQPFNFIDKYGLAACWTKANWTKDHYVYRYTNDAGDTTYVGITKHPRLRAIQHSLGDFKRTRPLGKMELLNDQSSLLGKYEARGVEQHLIQEIGMQKPKGATENFGPLENKINSMSEKHRFYDIGTNFGEKWVAANHPGLIPPRIK